MNQFQIVRRSIERNADCEILVVLSNVQSKVFVVEEIECDRVVVMMWATLIPAVCYCW